MCTAEFLQTAMNSNELRILTVWPSSNNRIYLQMLYLPYKILQAVLQFQLHSSILSFLSRFYFSIAMLLFSFCSRYSYLHRGTIINNRWGIPYTLVHLSTPYYHLLLSRIVNRTRYFQVILCNDQALAILMSMYIRTWKDSLKF